MEAYISFRDTDEDNVLQYYILQRDFPHYLGVISVMPVAETLACVAVPGYSLWIVFDGTLRGNMIPGYKDVAEEIQSTYEHMAEWFRDSRIMVDEKRYKKFKINQ